MHRGVYVVGHRAFAELAPEAAALLACGRDAVISHTSAARLWKMAPQDDDDEVHVTLVGRTRRSQRGLRVHWTSRLDPVDVRQFHGLRVTAPGRTVLDLAAFGWQCAEDAFVEAHARRLVSRGDLEAVMRRAGSRPGITTLRQLIDAHRSGFTRSQAERELLKLIRAARLPEPQVNARVLGYMVDLCWPDQRLVVEVDGFAFHGHRLAFERDRSRDARLIAAGYRVLRVTWLQLVNQPLAVIANIAAALRP
jgi:very-short-patch-repair endonuclease